MLTETEYRPIVLNERGRPVIAGTRFKVIFIGVDRVYRGMTPEEIVDAHPGLTLAQVHAALGYFYEHRQEFEEQLEREREEYQELWEENQNSPLRQKLRAMGKIP